MRMGRTRAKASGMLEKSAETKKEVEKQQTAVKTEKQAVKTS